MNQQRPKPNNIDFPYAASLDKYGELAEYLGNLLPDFILFYYKNNGRVGSRLRKKLKVFNELVRAVSLDILHVKKVRKEVGFDLKHLTIHEKALREQYGYRMDELIKSMDYVVEEAELDDEDE